MIVPKHGPGRAGMIRWLPGWVLGLSLVLTAGAVWFSAREVRRADQMRFDELVERVETVLRGKFEATVDALRVGRGLVEAKPVLAQRAWADHVNSVWPYVNKGVVGLGYIQRWPRSDLATLEAQVRADGLPGFKIEVSGQHEQLYGVTHLAPARLNEGALGLDIASGNTRRTAAETAMASGELALSRRIRLVFGADTVPGFLLLWPHYAAGRAVGTSAERTAAVQGWVYASLRADLLIGDIPAILGNEADIDVFEGRETTSATLLFDSYRNLAAAAESRAITATDYADRRFVESRILAIHGQEWTVQVSSLPAFEAGSNRLLPWLIFFSGVMLSGMMTATVWALTRARRRAIQLAERMTTNLRHSEAEARRLALVASRTASAVMLTDAEWRIDWINDSFTRLFGYTADEVKGRLPADFLQGPNTSVETLAAMAAAARAGESF